MWKNLNHPNIVPFKGVTFDPLQLVSEWMPGGELRHHVKNNPDAHLPSIVGVFSPPWIQYLIPPKSYLGLLKVSLFFIQEG